MIRKLFGVCAVALVLVGCASVPADNTSPSRQLLQRAQTTYLFVSLAAATYGALPACVDNGPKVCKNDAIAKQIVTGVTAAGTALELAQAALEAGDSPSTYQKVKLALDAAVAALSIARSYGLG